MQGVKGLKKSLGTILFGLAVVGSMGQVRQPEASLAEARRMYNEQRYEEAIKQAGDLRPLPGVGAAASVVFARAHLERYRVGTEVVHLDEARRALKAIEAGALAPRDQVEFTIALGELLYLDDQYTFDDRYGAAAEQFEVALGRAHLLDQPSRDLLFDWWALSLDRQAQLGPEAERRPSYQRIVDRAERELASDHGATAAAYWLAAGARGVDDLSRAWSAAVAGWVRASALGPRGGALREDLDRLVTQVILPERAIQLSDGGDARPALVSLEGQWKEIKDRWR
jgi:hypothetical protein